jgi:hypothetical protein
MTPTERPVNDNNQETMDSETAALFFCMIADTNIALEIRCEIIAIVKAWHRGDLLPRDQAYPRRVCRCRREFQRGAAAAGRY